MKLQLGIYFVLLVSISACTSSTSEETKQSADTPSAPVVEEVRFQADDSVTVVANLYTQDSQALTLLLFHQAGSNARGEYSPIIPRLLGQGYNILAVDLRLGGALYGESNRTFMGIPHNDSEYCDAYPDVEAALEYVQHRGFTGPIVAWGSSYSASLAIRLGAEQSEELAGVMAFSPASGEPMANCKPEPHLQDLTVPLIIFRPGSEMEIETVADQLAQAKEHGHQTYIAKKGVHGSSMLVQERAKSDVEGTWMAAEKFLKGLEGKNL